MRFSKSTANCWTILCGRGAWPEDVEEGSPGPGGWEGLEVQPWGLRPGALLQQGLGLARRVIRSEVLVLIHLFLNGQQLALQLVPKSGQCVPDVVGQLLGVASKEKVKVKVTSLNTHRPRHGEGGRSGGSVDARGTELRRTRSEAVGQWFSAFQMLRPFNAVPPIVVTPTIRLFLLILHNCNFATVMNSNVNI